MSFLLKPISVLCLSFLLIACGGGSSKQADDFGQQADPVTPTEPETSVSPSEPETSITPTEPVTPVMPSEPVTPVIPSEPETPDTPTEPDTHVSPSEPETPDTPTEPETPDTSNDPETPETPTEPETPVTPTEPETSANSAPEISGAPAISIAANVNYSFTPTATDVDNDTLSFSILNKPTWASFNKDTGVLTGTPTDGDEGSTSGIIISVSDGALSSSLASFNIKVAASAMTMALRLGDASLISKNDIIKAFKATVSELETKKQAALTEIYKLNSNGELTSNSMTGLTWNPSRDSVWYDSTKIGDNFPIIVSNLAIRRSESEFKNLAMAGEKKNGARFVAMGSNVLHDLAHTNQPAGEANAQMQSFMQNTISWLTKNANLNTSTAKIVIAHQSDSYWFRHDPTTHAWVKSNYPQASVNQADSCESRNLASCLTNADLLIIGRESGDNDNHGIAFDLDATMTAVKNAQANGIPVLYLQYDGVMNEFGNNLMNYFGLRTTDNYWRQESLSDYSASASSLKDSAVDSIDTTISVLASESLSLNFNSTNCPDNKCDPSLIVDNASGESYQSLLDGSNFIKSTLKAIDANNQDIFANQDENLFLKLVVLLADKYRQETTFPMDKYTSDSKDFMRALFADYAIYNSRNINPVQNDMGNYSRSDFSHITPTSKTVTMQSKKNFRSAGVYALPGQTFTVTRNDTSELTTKIYISSVRSGSTHLYEKDGYKRPKFIQSAAVEVKSGETIKLTSPLGGPIQITFSSNDLDVSFTFKNIGEHAYWKGPADNQRFTDKLAANEYDWAELVTPGFEVHSKLDKMVKSMNDPKWGSAVALAEGTMRYMHNLPHGMAGFKGPGIDVIPELTDFANNKGWEMNVLDKVQHMNADQASCGYGCSGNPYDAYWSYDPIGHGDVHELGHGLQGGKRIIGWQNHTMTNFYSYNTKSKYHTETGGAPSCQALPFEKMFYVLQKSAVEKDQGRDPSAYIDEKLWDFMGWSEGAGMFVQMMMASQASGALQDGWMLRGRLHMFEREFTRAMKSETIWLAKRASLGMDQYSFEEAKTMDTNDWHLLGISYSTDRDYRDYFEMWAIPFSDKAATQVASYNYAMIAKQFFVSDSSAYCYGLDKPAVAVDGQQTWPEFN